VDRRHIIVGEQYALREPVKPGVEFQHIRVLQHVRGTNWRVEWVNPNRGLIDFVTSKNIIVPWKERAAFLRDERNAQALARFVGDRFPGDDSPIVSAVESVLSATGEGGALFTYRGVLHYEPDALARVAARAGVDPPTHHAGYVDRHGEHHLPFECAISLARAFAAAEPRTVLDFVDGEERAAAVDAREPGHAYMTSLLAECRASWALVRQWAGHDAAVAAREERILELERLLTQTMWDLRRPGVDSERVAARIDRALRGR